MPAGDQRRIAVVIGCSTYDTLPPLHTSANDARAMEKLLRDPGMGHFTKVVSFIGGESENKIVSVIEPLIVEDANPKDLVLVYFSGHGKLDTLGNLYLALKKTKENSLDSSSIGVDRISNYLQRSRCKSAVMILDCCYSGAVKKAFAKGAVSDSLIRKTTGSGLAILTSSTDAQESYEREGDEYSLFTKMLLDGVTEGYADTDNDGVISVDDVYAYAYNAVRATGLQHPARINLDARGDLLFARNPKFKPEDKPSLDKCPPQLVKVYLAVDQLVGIIQRGEQVGFGVMLGGYWIEGYPYRASSLTVSPGHTPNIRLTQDGFESDTWFEPHMIQAETLKGKEVIKHRRQDGSELQVVKVRLKVFLKDIGVIAGSAKGQQVMLYQDADLGAKMMGFMQESEAFFEKLRNAKGAAPKA